MAGRAKQEEIIVPSSVFENVMPVNTRGELSLAFTSQRELTDRKKKI